MLLADAVSLADGRRVIVRPIGPRDAGREQAFFTGLSRRSRYRRFHLALNSLPQATLRSLTEVDQRHHVALVALADESEAGEGDLTIVADARYVSEGSDAEFAIAVADDWQGVGLGSILLRRLGEHARRAGHARLVGDLLADNLPMRALVRKFGGRIAAHPDSAELRRAIFDTMGLGARPSRAPALALPA
jgi:GNAT superfamily N-acetyltransferase